MEETRRCLLCGEPAIGSNTTFVQMRGSGELVCAQCLAKLHETAQIAENNNPDAKPTPKQEPSHPSAPVATPKQLKEYLDQYVIGQDEAKKALAVACYDHYQRIALKAQGTEVEKSNVLLVGPTGTGKTAMLRLLAKKLDVPFVIEDATSFSETGYNGREIGEITRDLLQNAKGDMGKAEQAIVYLDELDKLSCNSGNYWRDANSRGTQQCFLKLLEGAEVDVPSDDLKVSSGKKMNTDGILFVCGGAFEGIEKIIAKRVNANKTTVGFGSQVASEKDKDEYNELISQVTTDDLKQFGMMPELLGRVPIIATLRLLDKADLARILREPKNALLRQTQILLGAAGVQLQTTDDAMELIAEAALKRKVGARGLRGILEGALKQTKFEAPDHPGCALTLDAKDGRLVTRFTQMTVSGAQAHTDEAAAVMPRHRSRR